MLLFHKQQGVDEANLGLNPAQLLDVPSIVVYLSAEITARLLLGTTWQPTAGLTSLVPCSPG
jgi:hypothetical protein